ncbi:hypothetical protein KC217_22160, partial [Mycobacterium tuberculosis]|nr:hypothetical protein [Mycobacterium tuberculosis]
LAQAVADATAAERDAEAAVAAWRAGAAADWALIDLGPDASLDETAARLAAWRDVPAVLRARDEGRRRLANLDRDRHHFAAALADL